MFTDRREMRNKLTKNQKGVSDLVRVARLKSLGKELAGGLVPLLHHLLEVGVGEKILLGQAFRGCTYGPCSLKSNQARAMRFFVVKLFILVPLGHF
jgi:hypothetical protein